MAHNVINLSKVQSIYNGNLESMIHTADLDNASFCHVGAVATGEIEVKEVKVPDAASILNEPIVVIASDEVIKDSITTYTLSDFYNKTGEIMKAYHLTVGDVLEFSASGVDGVVAVGQYLVPQAGSTKLVVAADRTGGTRFAAKIVSVGTIGWDNHQSVKIQVEAN